MYRCFLCLFILVFFSCAKNDFQLQPGDLLFQQWDESEFAKAINAVTEGYDRNDFAHVGLVLEHEGQMKVLEATMSCGVCLTPLDDFLEASVTSSGKPRIAVGRLKSDYQPFVNQITNWSLNQLEKTYDTLFIYGNDKYYCAELLHDAFNIHIPESKTFDLAPMTFKVPGTDNFFTVWIDYFEKTGETIPEGEPGINPGLMSQSANLEIVQEYFNQ